MARCSDKPAYWNTERKSQCRTYIFSQYMMTFIYNSVFLPDFTGCLQVRFAFNNTLMACLVVESSIALGKRCLISLNSQSLSFLSRKKQNVNTLFFIRSNHFLDSLGDLSSRFASWSKYLKHLFLDEDFTVNRRLNFALMFSPYCCCVYFSSFILFDNC